MIEPLTSPSLLDVAPRSRALLHGPVAFCLDGLSSALPSRVEMRRQLNALASLVMQPVI